jgi:hypothetical protein
MTEHDWQLIEAMEQAGIRGKARRDAYRRGIEHFEGRQYDAIDAFDYYNRDIRHTASHLYQTGTPQAAPPRPPEKIDWYALPPTERLTRWREQQAAQQPQR